MLRGAEFSQGFARAPDGSLVADGKPIKLVPGQVEAVSPKVGDIHQVSNAYGDQVSISIHVYGANIGAVRRAVYQPDGSEKPFISGYSNAFLRTSGICPKKRALPYEHRTDPQFRPDSPGPAGPCTKSP